MRAVVDLWQAPSMQRHRQHRRVLVHENVSQMLSLKLRKVTTLTLGPCFCHASGDRLGKGCKGRPCSGVPEGTWSSLPHLARGAPGTFMLHSPHRQGGQERARSVEAYCSLECIAMKGTVVDSRA